jgi:hypothetical protein
MALRENDKSRGKTHYWVTAAKQIGLMDCQSRAGGVRFAPNLNEFPAAMMSSSCQPRELASTTASCDVAAAATAEKEHQEHETTSEHGSTQSLSNVDSTSKDNSQPMIDDVTGKTSDLVASDSKQADESVPVQMKQEILEEQNDTPMEDGGLQVSGTDDVIRKTAGVVTSDSKPADESVPVQLKQEIEEQNDTPMEDDGLQVSSTV